jgi:hypothetical protein
MIPELLFIPLLLNLHSILLKKVKIEKITTDLVKAI